jgi:hypothetical protein
MVLFDRVVHERGFHFSSFAGTGYPMVDPMNRVVIGYPDASFDGRGPPRSLQ